MRVIPKIEFPEEVVNVLGDDPEHEAPEAVLLHLIRAEKVSVAWAGERLGLARQEVIRWYTSHGYPFPDITPEEFDEELRYARELSARREVEDGAGGASARGCTMTSTGSAGGTSRGRR